MRTAEVANNKKPKLSLLPALACLFLSLMIAATGIALLSRRSKKDFLVQASCSDVSLTQGLSIHLDPVVDSFHLINFRGTITHVDQIQLTQQSKLRLLNTPAELRFQPDEGDPTGAPPSLRLKRMGTATRAVIQGRGVFSLRSAPLLAAVDEIDLNVGSGSSLVLQAERYQVAASRYRIEGMPRQSGNQVQDFSDFGIASASGLMQGAFETPASVNGEDGGEIALIYPAKAARISLLDRSQRTVDFDAVSVSLTGCSNASLQIQDGTDVKVREEKSDFTIQATGFRLNQLFVTERGQQGGRLVAITGNGSSQSILQEQKQLIPTELADIFNRKPYEVGITGAALFFCVFAGGVFVKRSLEVLAKRWIPE